VPERFELGTPAFELMVGTAAAVEFLAGMDGPSSAPRRARLERSMAAMGEHEDGLRRIIEEELAQHSRITVHSRARNRTPTLLFTVDDMEPREVAARLGRIDINVPAGNFYALEASRRLGLGDTGGVRIGLAPYTSAADVDRLLEALRGIA
jgi:selenocysteine lyase/cysteine desulfurase